MNMRTAFIIFFLLILLGFGCRREEKESAHDEAAHDEEPARIEEPSDLTAAALRMADSLLAGMTEEQKIAQLFMPAVYASDDYFTVKAVREYGEMGVCGIVLLKGDSRSAAVLSDTLSKTSALPPFVAIDAEWGLGMRLKDKPKEPSNSERGMSSDEAEMFDYGAATALQCREIGINMILGPVMDVAEKPAIMASRSYGKDPHHVADLAIAYARGLESRGVMSVAKHFPGHGSAVADSHKRKAVISRSLHDMDSLDLYPFRKYIEQGLPAVMVGHLAVPAIDPEMMPAAVSKTVITDLLRTDLEFRGLVLTDAMNMGGAEGNGADKAIEAGADIILVPADTRREMKNIRTALEKGELTQADLDNRLRRILFHKSLLRLRTAP